MFDSKIAEKIAVKMMNVIPYNVNIMNDKGIIIGGGDKERIGEFHRGALMAIETRKVYEVYKEEEHVKKGVNVPILFKENIIGVIGISGEPTEVKRFAEIVKVTTELLVEQEYSINKVMRLKKQREDFLNEWIYVKDEYDFNFYKRAKELNFNIQGSKRVIVINLNEDSENLKKLILKLSSKERDYIIANENKMLCIIDHKSLFLNKLIKFMNEINNKNIKIGIGSLMSTAKKSTKQALKALEIGERLYKEQSIINFNDVKIFSDLIDSNNLEELLALKEEILNHKIGKELLNTLIKYVHLNGDKKLISKELNIHRNTLNYRLSKLSEITNLNFSNYLDLYKIISLTIYIELSCASEQKSY